MIVLRIRRLLRYVLFFLIIKGFPRVGIGTNGFFDHGPLLSGNLVSDIGYLQGLLNETRRETKDDSYGPERSDY